MLMCHVYESPQRSLLSEFPLPEALKKLFKASCSWPLGCKNGVAEEVTVIGVHDLPD